MAREQVPISIRERVIKSFLDGKKSKFISETLGVKLKTVQTIIHRHQKGTLGRPRGHRKKLLGPEEIAKLHEWIDEDAQRTLDDLREKLIEQFNKEVSVTTLWRSLDELHYSFKRVSRIPAARLTEGAIDVRYNYANRYLELDDNRDSVFFVDETGVQVHCRTNYGRSLQGTRANITVRAQKGKNFSVCAAMNWRSLYFYEAKDTSYNTPDFLDFLKQFIEHLKENDYTTATIVMDNVRFHHADSVQELISQTPYEIVFLPPYSPFLNPIENLFNQLKFYVKRLRPSSADEVFSAVENASQAITENDCKNYYKNMMKYIRKCIRRERIEN